MTTFLFWNIQRKPLAQAIVNLARLHEVDVIILAECEIDIAQMLLALNAQSTDYDFPYSNCDKIAIYTRFSHQFLRPVEEDNRLTIRRLLLPAQTEILLASVHFTSKRNWSEISQSFEAVELADKIRATEQRIGHSRTVLVGDLNMNPFESGVVSAKGLHGVMTRRIAERNNRTVQAVSYPFFYNPMWNHFGDANGKPSGTHYYSGGEQREYFWNMFDQVLIRPDVLPFFNNDDLHILTTDGMTSFLKANETPNTTIASDHLPILFKLNL